MNFILGFIGIVLSLVMMRKREMIGDMIGDADWMHKVGGNYMIVIYAAIFIFFYSMVLMTGMTSSVWEPILRLLMPWTVDKNAIPF